MKEFFNKLQFALLDRWFSWHVGPSESHARWLTDYYYHRTALVSRDAWGKISWPRIVRIYARDTLINIFSEQTRAEWAAQKLYALREDYWKMQKCYEHFCGFVSIGALRRAAVRTWDFRAISGKIICFFCCSIDDVREIANSVAAPNRCPLVERVFEEAINTGQMKYLVGNEKAIGEDIAVLLLALEFARSEEEIKRLRAGMVGWLIWEKTPPTLQRMRDDFVSACGKKAVTLGLLLPPPNVENATFPYRRIPMGGI